MNLKLELTFKNRYVASETFTLHQAREHSFIIKEVIPGFFFFLTIVNALLYTLYTLDVTRITTLYCTYTQIYVVCNIGL